MYEHCGIAYLERVTVFSDIVSSVEMAAAAVGEAWQYVRTSYGDDILPTECPCISLDKINIITIIIVVVVVTDFSVVNLGLGVSCTVELEGMATGSVCVPTSKCRDGRCGVGGAAAAVSSSSSRQF